VATNAELRELQCRAKADRRVEKRREPEGPFGAAACSRLLVLSANDWDQSNKHQGPAAGACTELAAPGFQHA
jgi:hypothetical protein